MQRHAASGASLRPASAPAMRAAEATVDLTSLPPARRADRVDIAALPQDEEGYFTESHALLIGGNFPGAEEAFTGFLEKYPKGAEGG